MDKYVTVYVALLSMFFLYQFFTWVCSDLRELGIDRELVRTLPRLGDLNDRLSGQ